MLIPPYIRHKMPEGMDNSGFGEPCPSLSLFNLDEPCWFSRTITALPNERMPASLVFDSGGVLKQTPSHYGECDASFRYAFTEPVKSTLFPPNHGTLVHGETSHALIAEGHWHDELWFDENFRNDASTRWSWRMNPTWSHNLRYKGLIFNGYHRYNYQYFHWTMDCLPRLWMLKNSATYGRPAKWLAGPLDKPFHLPSLELLDISLNDCIRLPHEAIASFDELVTPAFLFQESLKTLRPDYRSGTHHVGWSRAFVNDMRQRAVRRYNLRIEPELFLYVSRGDAAHRRIRNETALLELLKSYGFQIVVPGNLSFREQVEIFARARAVVGIHGAGLTNIMWSAAGTPVLELAPGDLKDTGYRFLSNLNDLRHHVVMCETFEHPLGAAYADIAVDIDAVRLALIEMIGHATTVAHAEENASSMTGASHKSQEEVADWQSLLADAEGSFAQHNYETALLQVESLCASMPGNAWIWLVAGRIHRAMGNAAAMTDAFQRALSLQSSDPQIPAAFELLHFEFGKEEFSNVDLIDFALARALHSEQAVWFKAPLLFLKAIALVKQKNFTAADDAIQQAFEYQADIDERQFLFPWLVRDLTAMRNLSEFPHLLGFAQRAVESGMVNAT